MHPVFGSYPLVNIQKTMERSTIFHFNGKIHYKWQFSIANVKLPDGKPPFSYGFPIKTSIFLWFSYGFPMVFPLIALEIRGAKFSIQDSAPIRLLIGRLDRGWAETISTGTICLRSWEPYGSHMGNHHAMNGKTIGKP